MPPWLLNVFVVQSSHYIDVLRIKIPTRRTHLCTYVYVLLWAMGKIVCGSETGGMLHRHTEQKNSGNVRRCNQTNDERGGGREGEEENELNFHVKIIIIPIQSTLDISLFLSHPVPIFRACIAPAVALFRFFAAIAFRLTAHLPLFKLIIPE